MVSISSQLFLLVILSLRFLGSSTRSTSACSLTVLPAFVFDIYFHYHLRQQIRDILVVEIMAPLAILVVVFIIIFLANRWALSGRISLSLTGRLAMSAMLIATGTAHFTDTATMVEIMPHLFPLRRELVYFTGVCELAAVVGLLWNRTVFLTSVLLIALFVAVLPANIAGSLRSIDYGGMAYGPAYLIIRIPMQIFFIWWVWYFGVKRLKDEH